MANVNNVVTGRYGIVNLRKVAGVKTLFTLAIVYFPPSN